MRNHFILIFIIFLLESISKMYGQSNSFNVGIEGGPGISRIHSDDGIYKNSSYLIGGISGGFFQYNFNQTIALKTGIYYELKGTKVDSKSDQLPPDGKLVFHLNYLSVPILFKVNVGKSVKFFANTGPYFAILFHESTLFRPESDDPYKLADETAYYNPLDIGIVLGFGISVPLLKDFLISMEFRDNYGLIQIRKSNSEFENTSYFYSGEYKGYVNSLLFVVSISHTFQERK
jgi:hypothetical protein